MGDYNYHIATKVVLLFIRLEIRFFSTSFILYFRNKTTLVVSMPFYSKPYYLILNKSLKNLQ